MSAVDDLLARCSAASSTNVVPTDAGLPGALVDLLRRRNGFYGFVGALHVLPGATTEDEHGITAWNDPALWRGRYDGVDEEWVFFAEDAFAGQFALGPRGVATFDPETGELDVLADSLERWAALVLEDHEFLTGWPVARAWQEANGPIPRGSRLVPRRPFVLGGEFTIDNLRAVDAAESLRTRAELARRIRGLPDGATIRVPFDEWLAGDEREDR